MRMNVVFDLGGVVVAWKPDQIIENAITDPELRPVFKEHVIRHPDWLELDRGSLTVDQAIDRAVARSGLAEPMVRAFVESVPAALVANEDTVRLIRKLKATDHPLYCLSNMPLGSIEYLEKRYDFFDLFDGKIISSRVGHCKPESGIYTCLLETYGLNPRETVFIDDVIDNLEAASKFGMATVHHIDVIHTELVLRMMGCPV